MAFSPMERAKFLADLKKDTDASSEYIASFKSRGLISDKRVSFDDIKKK